MENVIPLPISNRGYDTACIEFTDWLKEAKVGDMHCYYVGPYIAGKIVGGLAQKAYGRGEITLLQKKLEPRKFAYFAQKVKSRGKRDD